MAEDAHVDAVDFGVVAAAGVARFQTSLKPITGCLEGAEMKCRNSGEMISLHEQCRLADSTRQIDRFGKLPHRLAKIAAHVMDISEPPQRREEIRVVTELPAQILGTLIGRLHLARSKALRGNERAPECQLQRQFPSRA